MDLAVIEELLGFKEAWLLFLLSMLSVGRVYYINSHHQKAMQIIYVGEISEIRLRGSQAYKHSELH